MNNKFVIYKSTDEAKLFIENLVKDYINCLAGAVLDRLRMIKDYFDKE